MDKAVFFFAKLWRRTEALTDIEFVVKRYEPTAARSSLRVFRVFYNGVFVNCVIMASVTLAMAKIAKVILNLSNDALFTLPVFGPVTPTGVVLLLLGGAALLYSALSGLYGVVYTDLVQFVLAMLGSIGLAVIVYMDASGNGGMMTKLAASPDFKSSQVWFIPELSSFNLLTFAFFVYIFVAWWGAVPCGGYHVQRLLACRSEKDSVLAFLWYNFLHYVVRSWPWVTVGLLSVIYFPGLEDAESAFPMMIARWYWWRVNPWSEITAIVCSLVIGNILAFALPSVPGPEPWDLYTVRLLITIVTVGILWVMVTVLTSKKPREQDKAFYKRMRMSGPGWRRVAEETGIEPIKGELLDSTIAWLFEHPGQPYVSTDDPDLSVPAELPVGAIVIGESTVASLLLRNNGASSNLTLSAPLSTVLLNEIAAHTDYTNASPPGYESNDWLELFNATSATVPLGDWYLSDDVADLKKWAIPGSNTVAAGGWIAFDEITGFHNPTNTGFGLNKAGEQVFLSYLPGTAQDRVADALRFEGQENGLTLGRRVWPTDRSPCWGLTRGNWTTRAGV